MGKHWRGLAAVTLAAVLALAGLCDAAESAPGTRQHDNQVSASGGDADTSSPSFGGPSFPIGYKPLFPPRGATGASGSGPYASGAVLGSFDDMQLSEFLGATGDAGRPRTMWPVSGGPGGFPGGPPNPSMPAGVLCAICNPRAQRCDMAYFGKAGRFCGGWADNTEAGHSVACCPEQSHCIMDAGHYIGCTAPEGTTGALYETPVSARSRVPASHVVSGTAWLLVWYVGATVAGLVVATLWWITHPPVKPVRAEDLPSLPERDAIVSFPVHRDVVFTTRAVFTSVVLVLASCEAFVYLYMWLGDSGSALSYGAAVRAVLLFLYGGVLGSDMDALAVRRFVVSDSLLEVSRRLRRPVAIRLSQVVSVRRLEQRARVLMALRLPFHYCCSYDDVVEVRFARDGCGPMSDCGRPYGVGVVLVTPQHTEQFVMLMRQRAQFTKDRVSQAAVLAMDMDSQPMSDDEEQVAEGSATRRHARARAARGRGWGRDDDGLDGRHEPKDDYHDGRTVDPEEASLLGRRPRPSAPPPRPARGPKDASGAALV